jgi:hypothetical protein
MRALAFNNTIDAAQKCGLDGAESELVNENLTLVCQLLAQKCEQLALALGSQRT